MLCDKDAARTSETEITPEEFSSPYLPVKIVFEWVVALGALVVLAPIIAMLAVLAKISSPGPAFYKQIRVGRNGQSFTMFKIRTMAHNCESRTGPIWSGVNDKRVTRIGRFLRDTHLDELPQLWNVLKGEMSLIGPRPERPELVDRIERAIPRYRERLLVRPGLTGLAQVRRPADLEIEDVRQKLAYDLYYIRRISLGLDMRIVLCTSLHMVGVALNSFGKLLVKSYGDDAERQIDSLKLVGELDQRLGAA